MRKFILTSAVILFCYCCYCQTIINSGPVSGTWTFAGSPYHIMGDIEVPAGVVLIIEPGVMVKIYSELSFKVYGQLLAEGTETDSIFFVPIATYWKGLQFLNSLDTSHLMFCRFQNFKNRTALSSTIKGGVIFGINSKIFIYNSKFLENQIQISTFEHSGKGGAICLENCTGIIKKSWLCENKIVNINSGMDCWGYGGAICCEGIFDIIENFVLQNSIDFNCSGGYGASAWAQGSGIFIDNGMVENNIIQGNNCKTFVEANNWTNYSVAEAACRGSGLFVVGVNCHLINNFISDNFCISYAESYAGPDPYFGWAWAQSEGGGVYGPGILVNNLIINNYCTASAQGDSYQIENEGGGIWGGNILSSTIINNSSQVGGGVYNGTIKNSIIYNNNGGQLYNSTSTYSCVQNGYPGQGNISSDPLFVNSSAGDYHLKQPPCQTQLSLCVNAGDPVTSLILGTTRTDEFPDLDTIDMGFHYSLTNPIVVADFNSNINCGVTPFIVNFLDNSYHYQLDSIKYEWDFENDGIVDSYEVNPAWTYTENGVYSVKQKITGYANDTIIIDSITKENFIISSDEFLVFAGFTFDKSYGEYPLDVTFNDISLITPCGEIEQWQWDFQNDGIIDSYLKNPSWTYSEPGLYSVKLIAGNSNYMAYDTILKAELITVCCMAPSFYAEPLSGDVPLEVNFFDTSFVEYTQISTWKWDFQHDGLIDAYGPNSTWIYPQAGVYSVELCITDTSGQIWKSVLKEDYIVVNYVTGTALPSKDNRENKLKIYPNPFTNNLIIEFEFDQPEIVDLQILDIAFKSIAIIAKNEKVEKGKKKWKWESQNNIISSGIYYIILTTSSNKQYIKKCIKFE